MGQQAVTLHPVFQHDTWIFSMCVCVYLVFLSMVSFFQLQTLIQETDPGADYRIDRALNEACESVIQTACKHIRSGDPM